MWPPIEDMTDEERESLAWIVLKFRDEMYNQGPLHEEDAETHAQVIERTNVLLRKIGAERHS